MDWTVTPPPSETPPSPSSANRWKRLGGKAALVGAGLLAGGVLAATLSANASPTGTASSGPPAGSEGNTANRTGDPDHGHQGRGQLDTSGTVTSVGPSSVTIRTASGTTTYAVTSSSDIDKNGEAQLSGLKTGDAVRFSTTTASGTPSIDKLHAGDESLDRPRGPHGGDGAGQPPAGYGYPGGSTG